MSDSGKIYLVPTPIGNLGDITERALRALNDSDLIACEDTRKSGRLLAHFNIKKKLVSYHDFNETKKAERLIEKAREGKVISIITDAGTPGISDPAYRIIREAIENNIPLIPLPGPSAVLPALTGSGLPLDRFFFEGFLSNKSSARRKRLDALKDIEHTLIFYESPHRIAKMINDCLEILGNRQACIARELTKMHEEFIRSNLNEINVTLKNRKLKGEIVVVIAGIGKSERKSREK